jgi:hypothetical protein
MVHVNRSIGIGLAALHFAGLASFAVLLGGCDAALPPATSPTAALATPGGDQSSVVFIMPNTRCDGLGYYIVADESGNFVGNLAFGTRVAATVSPGMHVFYAWSSLDLRYEVIPSWNASAATRVTLARGETQYVTIMPSLYPNCQVWPIMEMTAIKDGRDPDVLSMISNTKPVAADLAAGQSELNAKPALFQTNLELGKWKLRRLEVDEARRERRDAIAAELGWAGYSQAPSH